MLLLLWRILSVSPYWLLPLNTSCKCWSFAPDSPFPASHFLSWTIIKKTLVSLDSPSSLWVPDWLPMGMAIFHCRGQTMCEEGPLYWTERILSSSLIPPESYPAMLLGPVEGTSAIIKVSKCTACSLITRDQIVRNKRVKFGNSSLLSWISWQRSCIMLSYDPHSFPYSPISVILPSIQHLAFCLLPCFSHLPISEPIYMPLNPFTVTSCIRVFCGISFCMCRHLFPFTSRTWFSLVEQVLWLTCVAILFHDIMCRCVHLYWAEG